MHPPGYHYDEEARSRCWGCSNPEKLAISEQDKAEARQLIAEGWQSTSQKFHNLARAHVPTFECAISFASDVPEWLKQETKRWYENSVRYALRSNESGIEHKEVSIGVFRAFKSLGGATA